MNEREKIKAAVSMLKQLRKMVGFFMGKEISELIEKLEEGTENCEQATGNTQHATRNSQLITRITFSEPASKRT